jgi:hypothetical protein
MKCDCEYCVARAVVYKANRERVTWTTAGHVSELDVRSRAVFWSPETGYVSAAKAQGEA